MNYHKPELSRHFVHANKHWTILRYDQFCNLHKNQLAYIMKNYITSKGVSENWWSDRIIGIFMKTNYPKVKEDYDKVVSYCNLHNSGMLPCGIKHNEFKLQEISTKNYFTFGTYK